MNNPKEKFEQIYDLYIDKIYRFVSVKVNSQEIAEDLTSEAFLRFWQTIKSNRMDIENPQAFLYKIARNLVVDHYRQKGRTVFVSTDSVVIADPAPTIQEKTAQASDLEMIKANISKLSDDYQAVIIWHYIEDLPIPEIAKMTDKSEGAVRVTLHRALQALKGEINSQIKEA